MRAIISVVPDTLTAFASVVMLLVTTIAACGAGTEDPLPKPSSKSDNYRQWALPNRLREISGLAMTEDERLLAVTDEQAIVYELDYVNGQLIKAFAFGDPVVPGDFEGIAVLDEKIWLLTSDGILYSADEGEDGEHVSYERINTNHGNYCELEGLAQDRSANLLILACKETRRGRDELKLFEWSVDDGDVRLTGEFELPEKVIRKRIDKKTFNPSGIAVSGQARVLISARQKAIVKLAKNGDLLSAMPMQKKKRHVQAEGIEFTQDGQMLIADEGGDGRPSLTIYSSMESAEKR